MNDDRIREREREKMDQGRRNFEERKLDGKWREKRKKNERGRLGRRKRRKRDALPEDD